MLSDHKPLQFIFNNDKQSPKVLRWKLQLQEYDFVVRHCPGKSNVVADCLSRVFVLDEVYELVSEREVFDCQNWDKETVAVIKAINEGHKCKPDLVCADLWSMRNELFVKDNCLFPVNNRILVPFTLRRKVLTVGHGNHHGQRKRMSV